jgi:hypothetical protein
MIISRQKASIKIELEEYGAGKQAGSSVAHKKHKWMESCEYCELHLDTTTHRECLD